MKIIHGLEDNSCNKKKAWIASASKSKFISGNPCYTVYFKKKSVNNSIKVNSENLEIGFDFLEPSEEGTMSEIIKADGVTRFTNEEISYTMRKIIPDVPGEDDNNSGNDANTPGEGDNNSGNDTNTPGTGENNQGGNGNTSGNNGNTSSENNNNSQGNSSDKTVTTTTTEDGNKKTVIVDPKAGTITTIITDAKTGKESKKVENIKSPNSSNDKLPTTGDNTIYLAIGIVILLIISIVTYKKTKL